MHKWKIIADSGSDLHEGFDCAEGVGFQLVPLSVQVDGMSFIDEPGLDLEHFMDTLLKSTGKTSTACPSPAAWSNSFDGECCFAITITSALSGSYNAAQIGRDLVLEDHPDRKICIIDSGATSGNLVLIAQKINELIEKGLSFEEISEQAETYARSLRIFFTMLSFDNLIKNGRMNKLVGAVAKKLRMRIIGTATPEGRIEVIHKCRGHQQTLSTILSDMKAIHGENLHTRHVILSHCFNLDLAKTMQAALEEAAPGIRCTILHTHAMCSYYTEQSGLIVSF